MKKKFKLERYNQILWAGIGTAVVAVVVVAVFTATVAALYAVFKSRSGVRVAVVEENAQGGTVREAVHYDFCQPIVVHGSPYQLIRVVADLIVRDSNSDGKLDDKDAPSLIEVSVIKRKMVREVLDRASLRELMRAAEPRRTSSMPDR